MFPKTLAKVDISRFAGEKKAWLPVDKAKDGSRWMQLISGNSSGVGLILLECHCKPFQELSFLCARHLCLIICVLA